jgi:peptidoglycan/LPS O-acetylase OafA/YrhL
MLSRFRRITSGAGYVPEIDGIRFLAISSVFLFHLAGDILRHSPEGYRQGLSASPVFWATQVMNFGVQMFFVLSGLVLALPFASFHLNGGRPVSLKRYFLRRLTRLEPPYIAALIIFFFLKLAGGRGSFAGLVPHFAASVGYLHNLIYGTPSDINFVAWSLEIEVQFYICAPWLAWLVYSIRPDTTRRLVLAGCCMAAGFLASFMPERMSLSLAAQLPYFLAGMLLADFYVKDLNLASPRMRGSGVWDLAFVLTAPVIVLALMYGGLLIFVAPLTICFAYYAAFRGGWTRSFLRLPFVSTVGGMCYSIYLLHNYIIATAGMFTEKLTSSLSFTARLTIQSLLIGPAVLVVCGGFYLLIEQPCMRPDWPERFRARAMKSIFGPERAPSAAGAD